MNSLTAAYFVGELSVKNINGTSVPETLNLFDLQIAIAKYEDRYLEMVMGKTLFAAYAAARSTPTPDARWIALNDQLYKVNEVLSIGISPAANYVYFHFMRSQDTLTLVNAEVRASHENFEAAARWDKLVAAWNEGVRMTNKFHEWLEENADDYAEFKPVEVHTLSYINVFGF